MSRDVRGDLVLKLKEIFRSDRSDLDFGIYRILKQRRDEIHRYIEKELIYKAEEAFGELAQADIQAEQAEIDQLRLEINSDFGEGTIDENGEVTKYHEAKKIQTYKKKKEKLSDGEKVKLQINDVFNHVYEFFNRYYDKGDFISQRRFGGREKYVIPYKGEEVSLYWVNHDQYYVKTTEDYYKYSFEVGDFIIVFRLVFADVSQNNNKNDSLFQIHRDMPLKISEEQNIIEIYFEHRPLTEEDLAFYGLSSGSHRNTKLNTMLEKNYEIILENLNKLDAIIDPVIKSKRVKENLIQYTKKNKMDYFIHKNLGSFFRKELEFYIKNEVMNMDEWLINNDKNNRLLKNKIITLKKLCFYIIQLLDDLERFQLKLFEKKKFVLNTNYMITIGLIPEKYFNEIGRNINQVSEWKKNYKLDVITKGTFYNTNNKTELDYAFLRKYPYLVLDTKHFNDEFRWRLLSEFDNLNDSIEGILIKSENYQALNLISNKYNKNINGIYIDPPYNTGKDEFLYKDGFMHSSWLSMISNTAILSKNLLSEEGMFLSSIGNHELHRAINLYQDIYGENNYMGLFIWVNEGNIDNQKKLKQNHEYIISVVNNESKFPHPNVIDPNIPEDSKLYRDEITNTIVKNGPKNPVSEIELPIGFPVEIHEGEIPPNPNQWPKFDSIAKVSGGKLIQPLKISSGWSSKKLLEQFIDNNMKPINDNKGQKTSFNLTKNGVPYIIKERSVDQSHVLTVLQNMGSTQTESTKLGSLGIKYTYPKPVSLIKYLISVISKDNSIILDYFAGSGPVAEAVIELNRAKGKRKYILIEMADCFEYAIKTRIKKIIFSSNWKNDVPISNDGIAHFVKYQYLEQFEDTLNNILFTSKEGYAQTTLLTSSEEFLKYIIKKETQGNPIFFSVDGFKNPFKYKIKTLQNRVEKEVDVDLVETFNYLLGIKVIKIRQYRNEDVKYIIVYGEKENPNENTLIIWRDFDESKLETEKVFIEKTVIPELHPGSNQPLNIFINVDSYIKGAQSIEPIFKELSGIRND